MFDSPLHPVVVHFPIAIGVLLPLASLALWWSIKKGFFPDNVWILVIALTLFYGGSSRVAVEFGEQDEEKTGNVVSEAVIEEHEEAGGMVPWIAGGLILVSLAEED